MYYIQPVVIAMLRGCWFDKATVFILLMFIMLSANTVLHFMLNTFVNNSIMMYKMHTKGLLSSVTIPIRYFLTIIIKHTIILLQSLTNTFPLYCHNTQNLPFVITIQTTAFYYHNTKTLLFAVTIHNSCPLLS